jgi:hypothetical protein
MSLVQADNTRRRRGLASRLLLLALALTGVTSRALASDSFWMGEVDGAAAWASGSHQDVDAVEEETRELELLAADSVASPMPASTWIVDPLVSPAQAAPVTPPPAPRRGTTPTAATRGGAPTLATGAVVGLASVPFMIGDTGAGTCIGFQGLIEANLSHPTLACARTNIAEANTALPVDRIYYSYRHFHNASTVSAYQFSQTLDYDRHLIAGERTFWDGAASFEMRLPIERHLTSNVFSTIVPSLGIVEVLDSTEPAYTTELGNIAGIFKYLLWEDESLIVSGGLGVTLPTARDVDYNITVDNTFDVEDMPGVTARVLAISSARFSNETVYLQPFLAWLYHPGNNWFHQGFFQVEVAANPTRVTFISDGVALFEDNGAPIGFYNYFSDFPGRLDLQPQTLMRANLGLGRVLVDRPRAVGLRQLAALFEVHCTHTLSEAHRTNVPLVTEAIGGTPVVQTITIGNECDRTTIVNASAGFGVQWNSWSMTNGFIAPVPGVEDRGFDFEYNMQLQRLF